MKKLNFLNIKGSELSREEMGNIMAGGSGSDECGKKCYGNDSYCSDTFDCNYCTGGGRIGDDSTCSKNPH